MTLLMVLHITWKVNLVIGLGGFAGLLPKMNQVLARISEFGDDFVSGFCIYVCDNVADVISEDVFGVGSEVVHEHVGFFKPCLWWEQIIRLKFC